MGYRRCAESLPVLRTYPVRADGWIVSSGINPGDAAVDGEKSLFQFNCLQWVGQ